jgi:hypothetical protein
MSDIQVNANKSIVEIQKSSVETILAIYSKDSPIGLPHPLFNDTCAFCKKNGHWVQNCPTIPLKYRNFCYRCWDSENHTAKICTIKQQKPPWLNQEVSY